MIVPLPKRIDELPERTDDLRQLLILGGRAVRARVIVHDLDGIDENGC